MRRPPINQQGCMGSRSGTDLDLAGRVRAVMGLALVVKNADSRNAIVMSTHCYNLGVFQRKCIPVNGTSASVGRLTNCRLGEGSITQSPVVEWTIG